MDVWSRLEKRAANTVQRRQLERVAVLVSSFHNVFSSFLNKTPMDIFKRIKEERDRLKDSIYPDSLIAEMVSFLDRYEIALYEVSLPTESHQEILIVLKNKMEILQAGFDLTKEYKQAVSKGDFSDFDRIFEAKMSSLDRGKGEQLGKLRLSLLRKKFKSQEFQSHHQMPIGKGLTGGRIKCEGKSVKDWPVLGACIYEIYKILLPLYPAKSRLPTRIKNRGVAKYPVALLKDIKDILTSEFSLLSDITAHDILSRIQYRERVQK